MNTSNNSTSDADTLDRTEDKDSAARVQSLLDEAVALHGAGNFRDALRAYQFALNAHRHVLDGRSDDNISARILHATAVAYADVGQHDDAVDSKSDAVQIQRRLCAGVDDERLLAQAIHTLGGAFEKLGRCDDALMHFTESLEIRRRLAYGADNEHLAKSLYAVGITLSSLNRLDEALPHLRDALAMLRRLSGGRDSEDLSNAMVGLAVSLACLSRDPEEQRSLNEESLNMKRRLTGGNDDVNFAISIGNMGVAMMNKGDTVSALRLYTESYEMLMHLFPNGHRTIARTLCNIGGVLIKREETRDEGEKKIDEGFAMFCRVDGDSVEHRGCLRQCGADLVSIGRVEKGEQFIKEGDEMAKRVAEVADVATAAAAFSITMPAHQVDMSGISRSNYPQPRSETQPSASDVLMSIEKNAVSTASSASYAAPSSADS